MIVLAPVLMAAACYVIFVCFQYPCVVRNCADEGFFRPGFSITLCQQRIEQPNSSGFLVSMTLRLTLKALLNAGYSFSSFLDSNFRHLRHQ